MHSNSRDTVLPFILFSQQIGIQEGVEDEASEEERHSKRSSDSLIFLDGLRMMYGGRPGRSGRGGHLGGSLFSTVLSSTGWVWVEFISNI